MMIRSGPLHAPHNRKIFNIGLKRNSANRSPLTRPWVQILGNLWDTAPIRPHQVQVSEHMT